MVKISKNNKLYYFVHLATQN